jgi:hypothetical protein
MVGNGVTDYDFDNQDRIVEMSYWFGILPTTTYLGWKAANCSFQNETLNAACTNYANQLGASLDNINIYDAFGICW